MSNKKHNIEEIKTVASTPTTPDSGYSKIYPKSDGEWYRLNDAGDEAPLGGVSGTVTSVGLALDTIGSDISISDSPITSAGEITLNIPDASSSARGALTSSDWSVFNNKIGGSGTLNFISKFDPDGSTIAVSQIYDDGTCLAIGYGPGTVSNTKLSVRGEGSLTSIGGLFSNDNVITDLIGYGIIGASIKATGTNIGVSGRSITTNTGTNIGITGTANSGATANIGGHFIATGSNARAVKLEDSTAASYRVLRCLDSSGNAEWTQNLYSFQAYTVSGSGIPATLTASTQLNTSPVLNHGTSDPNAVQLILPAAFDNGLASSYNTSTGVFAAPATGWYLVGVSMSLTNTSGWPVGTSLLCCVELTDNTASTIILGTSTVDNYQPRQVLLDSNRLVYLGSGQQFRLNILLKGTSNYIKPVPAVAIDSIKWSVIRTA